MTQKISGSRRVGRVKPVVHRDQIHGDVKFDPLCVSLLGTDALQRLGRIYQLGYAHLVYRGGTHTRLSHVMGATHTAAKIVDSLRQNYSQKQSYWPYGAIDPDEFLPFPGKEIELRWDFVRHICSWAALLHDAAHIPMGHTLEDEFDKLYPKHDDLKSPRLAHLWAEDFSGGISEIRSVLQTENLYPESFKKLGVSVDEVYGAVLLSCMHKESKESAPGGDRSTFSEIVGELDASVPLHQLLKSAVQNAARNRTFAPYFADIVGDTICADYLDYLRRDPTNVGLDVLRDDRVVSRFYVGKEESTDPTLYRMALSLVDRHGHQRLDTCTGVIDLVRQRFRFAEIIYYHKTKVAASAMFAKAIKLIGKPEEVGDKKKIISIGEVSALTTAVLRGHDEVVGLRKKALPKDLLDPEVGDESLHVLLQYKGWEKIEEAVLASSKNQPDSQAESGTYRKTIEKALRGIALLQAISRRRLYKTCVVLDQELFTRLMPGAAPHVIEERLQRVIGKLRDERKGDGEDLRTSLETNLTNAAGWPEDALILYVPGRKSQAKGIETYALQANTVVTLDKHPAVQNKVQELNDDYKKLWRLIVLINPDSKYLDDVVGFSKAMDRLVQELISLAENRADLAPEFRTEWQEVLPSACWLKYVPQADRTAAQSLVELSGDNPSWDDFEAVHAECSTREYRCDSWVHAGLGYLSAEIQGFPLPFAIDEVIRDPSLASQFKAQIQPRFGSWSDDSRNACRDALRNIGDEIRERLARSESVVVPIRPAPGKQAQDSFELSPVDGGLKKAARGGQGDGTAKAAERSDEEIFESICSLGRRTKTWEERLAAIQAFLREDNIGNMSKNIAFIEYLESECKRQNRAKTYAYSIEDVRNAYGTYKEEGK
ncbi:MAG: hypothetical protein JSS40_17560 [Proteobacteria bacterium]|nr:hypothetical protein [Pseudomonadota bacterium]